MPAPEPGTVWFEESPSGSLSVVFQRYFWTGKAGNRLRRARRLLMNHRRGWFCLHCGEEVETHKRADAVYCTERCRKLAARQRRAERSRYGDA